MQYKNVWTRTYARMRSRFKAANGLFAAIRLVSGLEKTAGAY